MKKFLSLIAAVLFAGGMMAEAYVKVTTAPDDWDGRYLIVYEGDKTHASVAFDGSLGTLDATNNGVEVTIIGDSIVATETLRASEFIINDSLLTSTSGYNIGKTAYSNGLDANKTKLYANTFALDGSNATITASGGCVLKYNYASDQLRFRYYKSGQKAIALYKYNGTVEPPAPVEPPVNLGEKTITEFITLHNEKDTCVLTGWVSSIVNSSAFYINDGTDSLRVYKPQTEETIELLDTIIIKTTYAEYKGEPQATQPILVGLKKYVVPDPTPTDLPQTQYESKAYKAYDGIQIVIVRGDKKYNILGTRLN